MEDINLMAYFNKLQKRINYYKSRERYVHIQNIEWTNGKN